MTKEKKLTFSSKTINAGSNAKTVKGDREYLTAVMYLAPYKLAGLGNVCSMAEMAGCHEPCLNTAGRGKFTSIQNARIRKTRKFLENKDEFMELLYKDIDRFVKFCKKHNKIPAVRLNGTSDIRWELIKDKNKKSVFEAFPDVQFYDYTKIPNRKISLLKNYHLTWSYSEANEKYSKYFTQAKKAGMNIAVVFRTKDFPKKFLNWKVINGDEDDLRFLDKKNSIVGLYAKGSAKKDKSGFVIDT